jgi:hypothetical protein
MRLRKGAKAFGSTACARKGCETTLNLASLWLRMSSAIFAMSWNPEGIRLTSLYLTPGPISLRL